MAVLSPYPKHTTDQFSWDPKTKTFTAESSDLRWPIGYPKLGQVYDDAADEGFTLISSKTDKPCVLAIDHIDPNNDYAGGWWAITFRPATLAQRDLFKVVVFND